MSDGGFADHFGDRGSDYARFRPRYPPAVFEWLAGQAAAHRRAWDAGTGSGQAAVALTRWFDEVVATDASAGQLAHAEPHPRVLYRVAVAGASGMAPSSVDLVTVAQAIHWFDVAAFWREVKEALAPNGVVALLSYDLVRAGPEIDAVLDHLYRDVLGPWWPPERRIVETGIASLPFPFRELEAPAFAIEAAWTLDEMVGYLGTWSAARRYQRATGEDPLAAVRDELTAAWGPPGSVRSLSWPLVLRVGRRPPRWRPRRTNPGSPPLP